VYYLYTSPETSTGPAQAQFATVVGRVGGAPSASVAAFARGFAGFNFDLALPVSVAPEDAAAAAAATITSNSSNATGGEG
jgi:hypothetical protein